LTVVARRVLAAGKPLSRALAGAGRPISTWLAETGAVPFFASRCRLARRHLLTREQEGDWPSQDGLFALRRRAEPLHVHAHLCPLWGFA